MLYNFTYNCSHAETCWLNCVSNGTLVLQAGALSKALELAEQCKEREAEAVQRLEHQSRSFEDSLQDQLAYYQRHRESVADILAESQHEDSD